jgi:dihydrofolate synthase/folylpolyglutamate synthase
VATQLARLLTASGAKTGLYTSPHLRSWTERIQLDGRPVADSVFEAALLHCHTLAQGQPERRGDLRFFDVLTLAAREIFGQSGARFGIYEAGIGGRLDATRALGSELVLLTSIGADHEALLGDTPQARLDDKARGAKPGGTVISAPLGPELDARLREIAEEVGFDLRFALEGASGANDAPAFQRRNFALARAAFEWLLPGTPPPAVSTAVSGRYESGTVDGVPYVVDVGHNPTAWAEFLDELPDAPHVVLVGVTEPRPVDEVVAALGAARGKLSTVVATTTAVRPSQPPQAIAGGLAALGVDAEAVDDRPAAFRRATGLARDRHVPLVVFGSNYIALDFLAWVADARPR